MLHIALTDDPFANLLMQRGFLRSDIFYLDEFRFQLRSNQPPNLRDIVIYTLKKDDFSVKLVVIGFGTTAPCGPSSNSDFAHFIHDNYEVFSIKKNSITTLPSEYGSDPTMLYLQSHRAKIDSWRDNIFCGSFQNSFHERVAKIRSLQFTRKLLMQCMHRSTTIPASYCNTCSV